MGWKGKGEGKEQNIQRHKPGRQTLWAQWEKPNLSCHTDWRAIKKLQLVRIQTWRVPDIRGVDSGTMWTDEGICRGRGSGRNNGGRDRKGYKKGQSHVNRGRSIRLSDWALCLTSAVCATFLLTPFLTSSLRNLTLYPDYYWGDWCDWILGQQLESEQGCRLCWAVVSATGESGSQPSLCHLCVCVFLGRAQLHYWLNLQTGKQQAHASPWDGDLGSQMPQAGLQQQGRRDAQALSCWRWWPFLTSLTFFLWLLSSTYTLS